MNSHCILAKLHTLPAILKETLELIMPDKSEIERRKQLARDLKFKARQEFEDGLPMSRMDFEALFDYLDEQLTDYSCDDRLKHSTSYLHTLKLNNLEEITEWFRVNGGYCDCEVLSNVKEKFDDNAIL